MVTIRSAWSSSGRSEAPDDLLGRVGSSEISSVEVLHEPVDDQLRDLAVSLWRRELKEQESGVLSSDLQIRDRILIAARVGIPPHHGRQARNHRVHDGGPPLHWLDLTHRCLHFRHAVDGVVLRGRRTRAHPDQREPRVCTELVVVFVREEHRDDLAGSLLGSAAAMAHRPFIDVLVGDFAAR